MLSTARLFLLMLLVFSLLAGCAQPRQSPPAEEPVLLHQLDPIVIRVEGYGAPGRADVELTETQAQLLAMRASKMDAYRSLAERVYGTRVQGSTTVHNLTTRDDTLRAYVDNLIRGARVISVQQREDGTYVTQMELVLMPRAQHSLLDGMGVPAGSQHSTPSLQGERSGQLNPAPAQQPASRYQLN